jgi:hypothetical protein
VDRLPQESLVQQGPTIADVKPGETVWLAHVQVDPEGQVWLQKTKETNPETGAPSPGVYFDIEVTHLVGGGWNVKITEDRLPFEPWTHGGLEDICFLATEIEIV